MTEKLCKHLANEAWKFRNEKEGVEVFNDIHLYSIENANTRFNELYGENLETYDDDDKGYYVLVNDDLEILEEVFKPFDIENYLWYRFN